MHLLSLTLGGLAWESKVLENEFEAVEEWREAKAPGGCQPKVVADLAEVNGPAFVQVGEIGMRRLRGHRPD